MVTRVQRGKERIEELKKKKTKDRERRTLVGLGQLPVPVPGIQSLVSGQSKGERWSVCILSPVSFGLTDSVPHVWGHTCMGQKT